MKKILIVDDIQGWVNHNKDVMLDLFNNDVQILEANSASQAYDILLEQQHLDIIITDLQMEDSYTPKFAGEWLIEQIKNYKKFLNTQIIIISASYNARTIANSYGVDCIPKSTALKCISAYKEILGIK